MNELFLIIQREYITRVRAKSFIIITLLTPLLLSSIILLPTYLAKQHEDYQQLRIGLADPDFLLNGAFDKSELSVEQIEGKSVGEIKELVLANRWEGIVYVAEFDSSGTDILYYSTKQPSVFLMNQIRGAIQKVVVNKKLNEYGIQDIDKIIRSAKESVRIENIKIGNGNTQMLSNPYQRPLCMGLGLAIYLFIFLFSSQVMRGVLEEKSNRVVELIITSVSPVKFMAGKIIGIALLGLTQIISWIGIMYVISWFMSNSSELIATSSFVNQRISQEDISQILNNLNRIDFNVIIPVFLFFFIGGYLLYSSLFAAIAASVNHNDDIQQVTMIVTVPLILAVFVLSNTINSPDSPLSYWFSIIPFTSPVVMMGRMVYGAPVQDLLLSISVLTVTVGGIIWLAGKIYKNAILYRGKKISVPDLITWIKNTNK